jgi:hypothetical protein
MAVALDGLLLSSQRIQKAMSHGSRAGITQLLSFVCGLRHIQLAGMFTKLLSIFNAAFQPCLLLAALLLTYTSLFPMQVTLR